MESDPIEFLIEPLEHLLRALGGGLPVGHDRDTRISWYRDAVPLPEPRAQTLDAPELSHLDARWVGHAPLQLGDVALQVDRGHRAARAMENPFDLLEERQVARV